MTERVPAPSEEVIRLRCLELSLGAHAGRGATVDFMINFADRYARFVLAGDVPALQDVNGLQPVPPPEA